MPEATCSGEPDAGNPHVRFDEGRGELNPPPTLPAQFRAAVLLYEKPENALIWRLDRPLVPAFQFHRNHNLTAREPSFLTELFPNETETPEIVAAIFAADGFRANG